MWSRPQGLITTDRLTTENFMAIHMSPAIALILRKLMDIFANSFLERLRIWAEISVTSTLRITRNVRIGSGR